MKRLTFFQDMLSSSQNVSSKRVCGFLGWLVCLFVVLYCTILCIQAPLIADVLFYCSSGLLGIDAIMSPFRNKKHETDGSSIQQNNSN